MTRKFLPVLTLIPVLLSSCGHFQRYPLKNFEKSGYAEAGLWSIEKRGPADVQVYHVHDGTRAKPGLTDKWNPSSIHVIIGADRALIIDTGNAGNNGYDMAGERNNLRALVDYVIGDKPYDIAITHNHGDHTGNIITFTDASFGNGRTAQTVYYPINDADANAPGTTTPVSVLADDPDSPCQLIQDGDTIDLGGGFVFTALEIPAHTAGSMAYVDADHELVATGDGIGSAHVWLFDPHIVPTFINSIQKLLDYPESKPIRDWSSNAVLMLGHDWQRWEHAVKTETLTVDFYRRQLALAQDLVTLPQTPLVGEAYPNMRGRIGYRFRAKDWDPAANTSANLIDIPIDNGVGPVHFTACSRPDFDYNSQVDNSGEGITSNYFITLKQLEGFYMIRDHNIDSIYLFINGPDDAGGSAFLIDASNGAPNYTGLAEYVKQKIGNRTLSIFITHIHGDHYGQLRFFTPDRFPGLTLYWPKYEYLGVLDEIINYAETEGVSGDGKNAAGNDWITNPLAPVSNYNGLTRLPAAGTVPVSETSPLGHMAAAAGVALNDTANLEKLVNRTSGAYPGGGTVKFVAEGDVIEAAGRHFEVIRMRVHTAGGEMLLDIEDRIVFSGDALGTQTTTGGIWVNNGPTVQFAIDEYTGFKDRYGSRFDKIYTGHNSYYVEPSYVDNAISALVHLKNVGYAAARYNVPEGRPTRMVVMTVNGELRQDDNAIDANRTNVPGFPRIGASSDEYNSASLDFPPFRNAPANSTIYNLQSSISSLYPDGRYLLSDIPGTPLDIKTTQVADGRNPEIDYAANNRRIPVPAQFGGQWARNAQAADAAARAAAAAYTDTFLGSINNPPSK